MRTLAFAGALALASIPNANGAVSQSYSVQEHQCLAKAIYYEARSEPIAGLHAVGHVVVNRSVSGRYPKSICGVVYQRGYKNRGCQFAWSCKRVAAPKGPLWTRSQQVATLILSGRSEDVSRGALNFHNRTDRVRYSTKHYRKTAVIGNHTFWAPKTRVSWVTDH